MFDPKFQKLEAITGDSQESLVKILNSLPDPYEIVAICPMNLRHVAYVVKSMRQSPATKSSRKTQNTILKEV